MNVVEKKSFTLMPAAPGLCRECATKHEPELPHNVYSLFYKVKFNELNGRWPTLEDAMSHCSPEMREVWLKALKEVESEKENKLSD